MNEQLKRIAELLERETGIRMREAQMAGLAAALARISPRIDAEQAIATLNDPARGPALLGELIDQVAVQETFFLREPRELEAIDWQRLRAEAVARGAEKVAVWASACASGEEPYSLAILASEALGPARPPVDILATDISERALRRAEEAVYSERSTRELSDARLQRFFIGDGRRSAVGEQLRSLVRFRRHNLAADPAPPSGEPLFDLILCRNVLIYFGAETVEKVVSSLEASLRPGGQLILGASDRLSSSARRLATVADRRGGAITIRPAKATKRTGGAVAASRRRPLGMADRGGGVPANRALWKDRSVDAALGAANAGEYRAAIEIVCEILAEDPLDAEAYFVRGLAELATDDPAAATASLRRALYIDPTFALAAFQLGRAHDLRGDVRAARRAYSWTLRNLDTDDERHRELLDQVEPGNVAAACRARLAR
jgi:chemotaxis protein methyltransferase CheR